MSKKLYPADSFEITQRKKDHIELTHKARTSVQMNDGRFNYEPMFFTHPTNDEIWKTNFLKSEMDFPFWISSMTGGVEKAKTINENLARLCGKYKLGMGLGSCRVLLEDESRWPDFEVRKYMGSQPLFANIGICQLEELLVSGNIYKLHQIVDKLEADGLIIHINPLQEWFQPGGDQFKVSPFETLSKFFEAHIPYEIIVKEVGQGFGPKSLKALLEMPIAAIEFGAFGGTNFSLLENMRHTDESVAKSGFIQVGHSAEEMVEILNALPVKGKEFIISGGIANVLDGYALKTKLNAPSLIGMASFWLKPAQESFEHLEEYFLQTKEALLVARNILKLKD